MTERLPITQADSDAVAEEFIRQWTPKSLATKGLHQTVRDIMFHLQDHGDVIVLKVDELQALTEWLVANDIGMDVFDDDCTHSSELKSSVKKLMFAWGRCWGMTNYDMGIQEEEDGSAAATA